MNLRLLATMFLACAIACVDDPKVDPCRDPATRPASCVEDPPDSADAGRDAAADSQVDTHGEGGTEPPLDASPRSDPDASLGLDTGVRDAAIPGHDAALPSDGVGPRVLPLQGDLAVHDPSVIEADGSYVIFSTGRGLRIKRSNDLLTWRDDGSVFAKNPAWIASAVPGATDLWAPDISYFGGLYHLYYSASTFGSRRSCIGHATATDLSAMSFVDHGSVVCTKDSDDYNAIDPAFIMDESGTPWLSFGSFWSGIKLIRLTADGQRDGTEIYSLASRDAVEAIEAPYVIRRGDYYYLFVSFDLCCRGASSTYRIMVGRSENVMGPYVDAEGTPMLSAGGGSMLVVGNQRWRGPGHNALLTMGEHQYLVYHAYDADRGGVATLRIAEIAWSETGWPLPIGP